MHFPVGNVTADTEFSVEYGVKKVMSGLQECLDSGEGERINVTFKMCFKLIQ